MEKQFVPIESRDYWVKIVGMLQQNWAIVEDNTNETATIYFIHDHAGLYASKDGSQIFDQISCRSNEEAISQLTRNGFRLFSEATDLQSMLNTPPAPFFLGKHPNGEIYSSGQYWNV